MNQNKQVINKTEKVEVIKGYGFKVGELKNPEGSVNYYEYQEWKDYFTLKGIEKFLTNHKQVLDRPEKEFLAILNQVLFGDVKLAKPVNNYSVWDLFNMLFENNEDLNPLEKVESDIGGIFDGDVNTIIANIIYRETGLQVQFEPDIPGKYDYIMTVTGTLEDEEKEKMDKVLRKYRDELISEEFKDKAEIGYQIVRQE